MRSSSLLLLLAAAGCYRDTAAPTDHRAAAPAGPPPTLAWTDQGFEAARLPAVSADGAAILIGLKDNDGGRGNQNYRLELRDRRDALVAKQVVLTVDEAESMFDADGKTAALDQRIAGANRWLTEQHAARRFTPFTGLEVEAGDELGSASRATGGGVTVEWKDGRLTIAQAGKTLVSQATPDSWGSSSAKISEDMTCENRAYLGGAAIDLEHRVALVTIRYTGTDMCWEPSDAPHVIAW
jgi:hypothetical protein